MSAKRNTWSRSAKFSTAFVRQTGFRYELESEMLRGQAVVWKDAESEKPVPNIVPSESRKSRLRSVWPHQLEWMEF